MSEQKSTRKWLQCLAGIGGPNHFSLKCTVLILIFILATLGGYTLGLTIGWASPAKELVTEQLDISDEDFSWIASIMPLGAAASMIFMAFCFDIFGRKWTMIGLAPFFTLSWVLLAFSNSMLLYCVARFFCGFCGGAFCVAAPNYTAELAESSIRGFLGTLFQLMVCSGIATSYALGELKSRFALSIPSSVFPIALALLIFFLHESPVFLLKRGKEEKARKSLQFFRGANYDIEPEFKEMQKYVKGGDESNWQVFKKKSSLKASLMLLVLHVGQQMSGINAVMFFAHEIFKQAGSDLSPGISSIILGIVQILATIVCTLIVDRVGRKILWVISITIMIICLVLLGVFFLIKDSNPDTAKTIGILPLSSLCVYLVGFSLGSGPLPWAMLGELLPDQIKSIVGSAVTCVNWLMAFVVTVSFITIMDAVGAPAVYFGFAVLQALTLAFIVLVLIETKNKSLDQIQQKLAG